ncbi:Probable inactive receptor kinase At5g67200 [Linum grandiflorum]
MLLTDFFLFIFFLLLLCYPFQTTTAAPQPDAVSILSFKSKADLDNKLLYSLTERFDYCQWHGVKCAQGRVVRVLLQGFGLRGGFPPDTLSRLDQLRVLSLRDNSLSGPIPDLSPLLNLKSLFLNGNSFSGTFPPSILFLHRLTQLDLSHNTLTGPIPAGISRLDRLISLRLEWNSFSGLIPPLNQSFLISFNISHNNLTGQIPFTTTLSRFGTTAFLLNPDLCGQIINKDCTSQRPPFFEPSSSAPNTTTSSPLSQSAEAQTGTVFSPPPRKHRRVTAILAFTVIASLLAFAGMCLFLVQSKRRRRSRDLRDDGTKPPSEVPESAQSMSGMVKSQASEKSGTATVASSHPRGFEVAGVGERSGNLVYCGRGREKEEKKAYNLEQLMKASAELLGRGSVGTTYKAVVDNGIIMTVKRLDAGKTAITGSEAFEKHMEVVGGLGHPNLVRIRAYFQAKGERLVIFDYQPNGSLFNLIHGSRSTRAKPLHWTSCLKIAEDVAQGLAYIHQASHLVHGNLKSSNVLLGPDFEACITDYCLAALADTTSDDPNSAACKAPETRKSNRRATPKSDVYAFGVLLLELLTGKHPCQHPYLMPADLLDWVRATREEYDGREDNQLGMLTEVASVCSLTSPEQRPAMWQVLKMIQQIKDSVVVEDSVSIGYV